MTDINALNSLFLLLGVVHKLCLQDKVAQVGGPKMSTFCQRLYHKKCQLRGVGGQKKTKSCQRSLWTTPNLTLNSDYKIIWRYFLFSIVLNLVVFCTSFFPRKLLLRNSTSPRADVLSALNLCQKMIDFAWNYLNFVTIMRKNCWFFACNTWSNVRKNSQLNRKVFGK